MMGNIVSIQFMQLCSLEARKALTSLNVGVSVQDVGDEDLPGVVGRLGFDDVDEVRHDFRLDGVALAQRSEPDGSTHRG